MDPSDYSAVGYREREMRLSPSSAPQHGVGGRGRGWLIKNPIFCTEGQEAQLEEAGQG